MDEDAVGSKKRKTIDEKTDEFVQKVLQNPEEYGIDPEEVRKLWDDITKKNRIRKTNTDCKPIYG